VKSENLPVGRESAGAGKKETENKITSSSFF